VELRNESECRGQLDGVDDDMTYVPPSPPSTARMVMVMVCMMNRLRMSTCTYKGGQSGAPQKMDRCMIPGRQIRYVQIPDRVDVNRVVNDHQNRATTGKGQYKRVIWKEKADNTAEAARARAKAYEESKKQQTIGGTTPSSSSSLVGLATTSGTRAPSPSVSVVPNSRKSNDLLSTMTSTTVTTANITRTISSSSTST
jgi:hypothetical protein